jgi:hypothetical protein
MSSAWTSVVLSRSWSVFGDAWPEMLCMGFVL